MGIAVRIPRGPCELYSGFSQVQKQVYRKVRPGGVGGGAALYGSGKCAAVVVASKAGRRAERCIVVKKRRGRTKGNRL